MRPRFFVALSALTLAVSVAAGVAVVREDRPQATIATSGPVLPGLAERLGEITSVVVRSADGTVTIRRAEGGWVLAERNDYPVPADKVRELVRSLVALEKVEPKTTAPDRYARLGVEDVTSAGARSKEVTLENASAAPIARLLVGKTGSGAGAEGATYVRVEGDAQTWLAKGSLEPSTAPRDWVERQLIEIPSADIQEVRVVRPDGSTLTALRNGDATGSFRLAELPKGATLKRPDAADSLVQPFADLAFDDFRPRDAGKGDSSGGMHVTVRRSDGGIVVFDVIAQDTGRWLRFTDGSAPSTLPAAAKDMEFQIPAWKMLPLERPLSELIDTGSGS